MDIKATTLSFLHEQRRLNLFASCAAFGMGVITGICCYFTRREQAFFLLFCSITVALGIMGAMFSHFVWINTKQIAECEKI